MSQKLFLLSVFAVSFLLRVATAAGAETEVVKKAETVKTESESTATIQKQSTDATGVTKIENHFHINSAPAATPAVSSREEKLEELKDAASVLGAKAEKSEPAVKVASIQPMAGITVYTSDKLNVKNQSTFGLLLDLPVTSILSLEIEGTYGRYTTKYSIGLSPVSHQFSQISAGMNAKIYLSQSLIRPYLIAGFSGVYYDNMYRDARASSTKYTQWIGAAQAGAGAEIAIATNIGIGARATYMLPVANRQTVRMNGNQFAEGYEDAGLMDSGYARFLGFVRVGF